MRASTPFKLRPAIALAITIIAAIPAASPAWTHGTPDARLTLSELPAPFLKTPAPRSSIEVAPAFSPASTTVALGPLPLGTPVAVAVGLDSRDPGGLRAWVAAAGIPGTSAFHHPLTPSQAAARFGASPDAVRSAEQYFEGFGLNASASPDGLLVYVQGPSSGVARAFGTTFEQYRTAGARTIFSHPTAAELPPIAPWSGAVGLGNTTPIVPAITGSRAAAAPSAGCSTTGAGLLPCSIESAYDIAPLYTGGINGTGERVAVVDAYSGLESQTQLTSDLATFASDAGISVGTVDYLYPVPSSVSLNTSGTNPAWGLEEALDLEWARAIAPGATIDMTFSPNAGPGLYAAIDWLVAQGAADAISLSWGEPDVGMYNAFSTPCTAGCNASSDGSYAILGPVLELAAAEGIGVFAASGDCGSADGTSGVSTNFPASDPYVTGVGGTTLTLSALGGWASETAWSGNGSGAFAPGCQNGGGSGGGYSPFPRPWWQTGLPTGTKVRGVPDVALDAHTPVLVEYNGGAEGVEGTSVATPIWAGIDALADQNAHVDLGLLDPSLYRILGGPRYATDFHDIVSGPGNGYKPKVGWDPVTGVGSPIVDAMVTDLARGGALAGGGLATYVSASPDRGTAPLKVDFSITASGGSGSYPLEGVSFGDANSTLTQNGSLNYTYTSPGVYSAQSFVVDSGGNASVSPPLTVVVGGGGTLHVTLHASTDHPATNSTVTFTASVTGGVSPYTYGFWFGDGASSDGLSVPTTTYAYPDAGLFCAVAVVADSAFPVDGGASPAVEISAGGSAGAACGNGSGALTVTPLPHPGIRDAPADFPALFNVSGGATGNGNPAPTISLTSNDPYTAACGCAIFRAPGNFTVNETAVDSLGARANGTEHVRVAPPLTGTFTASTLAGPIPLTVDFSASVQGGDHPNASRASWTFGRPGATGEGAAVRWTFAAVGEYLVTGVVADAGFGNSSESFLIDAEPPGGTTPVGMTGTVSPSIDIDSGTTVHFTASLIGAPPSATVFWQLGGSYSAAGPTANETYFASSAPANDVLTVDLIPEGPGLMPFGPSFNITLPSFLAVEPGGFVPAEDALAASAQVSPTLGLVPLPVVGSATVSGPGTANVAWHFGPSVSASGTSVSATLVTPANYTVTTVASDSFGDAAVLSEAVVATPPFRLVGGPSSDSGTSPFRVSFTALVTGGVGAPYLYLWTFGNGVTSYLANTTVTYSQPGTYAVSLQVRDGFGEGFAQNWSINVRAPTVFPVVVVVGGASVGILLAVVLGGALGRRGRRPPSP
ncbi:MAG: PKD domain-containing protein [Thermoplasmata archaeon]